MDLKEFTKQTLLQIVEGTGEANEAISSSGAFIPYTNIGGNCKRAWAYDEDRCPRYLLEVDFDVAITAIESDGKNGGASLKVASMINVGGGIDTKIENQTVSRVKYTLPLVLSKNNK